MFENFKERFHSVQQDFSSGFKTLGDKSKESNVRKTPRFEECFPHFSAGLQILKGYEDSWYLLHRRTTDCSHAAELLDGDIVMLSALWDKRKTTLTQLEEQLQSLPALITELDTITTSIAQLEGDFEEMESRMVYLETLCCQCEQQTFKQHHVKELQSYKKNKRKELNALEVELNTEHAQKVAHMEHFMQQKLRAQQKVYEEAFNQDMEKYLSTGFLTDREPTAADACELDHITVTNPSDQEALDNFLSSSTEDITSHTSLSSELWSCSSESFKCLENQSPNRKSAVVHEEDQSGEEREEPQVEPDEEEVHLDTSLAVLQDDSPTGGSDESDTA